MREIVVPIRVRGSRGEGTFPILFDTGATGTFIRQDIARRIASPLRIPTPIAVQLADGSPGEPIRSSVQVLLEFKGAWLPVTAYVLKKSSYELILGCSDMEHYDIRPIPRNGSYVIPKPKLTQHLI